MTTSESLKERRHRLEQAFEQRPDDLPLLMQLALVLEELDAYVDLQKLLAGAIKRWPQDSSLLMYRSKIHNYLGEFSAARKGYSEILRHEPGDVPALFSMVMQGYADDVGGLQCVETRLVDERLTDYQRSLLCYARARLLEKEQRFDEAFEIFKDANAIEATASGMNIAAKQRGARIVIEDIEPEIFEACSGHGNESERPVFIVGMPRSGTSLTEQILASHPDVYAAGERLFWGSVLGGLLRSAPRQDGSVVEAINGLHPLVWERAGSEYLDRINEIDSDAIRITDKLPGNFGLLPYIRLIFPRARIIHVHRDPLATIASCIRTSFSDPSLAFTVQDWARYYGIYQALMDHWLPMLGDQVLSFNYEELVNDLPAQARRLVGFLGLEWDDACLHPEQNKRAVRTASAEQVRRVVHTESIDAWRRYEKQLEALRPHIEESREAVIHASAGLTGNRV